MIYVDGFVAAVRADRKGDYRAHAAIMSGIFFECGALRIVESWGDDVPEGKRTDFRRAVQAEDGEVVLFSWIEWPSKEARDAGWKTLMADPRMQQGEAPPFDGKRMIYGGFAPMLDERA